MTTILKESIKIAIVAVFIGLLELLNSVLIEGKVYTLIAGVNWADFISMVLTLLLVLFIVRFGITISRIIQPANEFLSRLSKIFIWMVAFLILIFNDNFHTSMTQLLNEFFSIFSIFLTRSTIESYIVMSEVLFISVPLIRFFIYFFRNLDSYLDLFFTKYQKDEALQNDPPIHKDVPNGSEE